MAVGELIFGGAQLALAWKQYELAAEAARKAEEGGKLSAAASLANASDREKLGAINASAITSAASNTAEGMREVGYANAIAISEAALHNVKMYEIQSEEEIRLHTMGERYHAGDIRARMASTGIQVNVGSPMAYLRSEIQKGIAEREYMETRDAYAMIGIADDGIRKSLLTVKTANINANITEKNAALSAQVTMAEAAADAAAMRRQAAILEQVGAANAASARAAGFGSAAGSLMAGIKSLNNAYNNYTTTPTNTYSGANFSWSNGRKYY